MTGRSGSACAAAKDVAPIHALAINGTARITDFRLIRTPFLVRLLSIATLTGFIDVLTGDVSEQDANWNRRFRAHQEQLKSSDPRELAGVIRNLARRQDEKGLSGGERQLLLRAKRLLASELQYARKTDEEEALAWIDDVLSPDAKAA